MRRLALLAVISLGACGGGGGGGDDDVVDAGATVDVLDSPCQHVEANDDGNGATPESTGETVDADGVRICGVIDARPPSGERIDVDQFTVQVPAGGDYLVRLDAPTASEELDLVQLFSFEDFGHGGDLVGPRGIFLARVEGAGNLTVVVQAFDEVGLDAGVAYELTITPRDLDTLCAPLTGPADYAEASDDPPDHTGNDMVEVRTLGAFSTTQTAAADQPEPTALTIDPDASLRVTGDSGVSTNTYDDDYVDRDTYAITTGADTDVLTVRIDWDDAAGTDDDANLDAFLFPAPIDGSDATHPITSGMSFVGTAGPESYVTAVLPGTAYWLWVGGMKSPALGHAKPYSITICGATAGP